MKQCFSCKRNLPLYSFKELKREYKLKTDMGRVKVCKLCNFEKAIKTLSLVNYNFDIGKFEVIKFESIADVSEWFVKNKMI